MTGMHVREPRPCTSPLRGEHSGYKGPTGMAKGNFRYLVLSYLRLAGISNFEGNRPGNHKNSLKSRPGNNKGII